LLTASPELGEVRRVLIDSTTVRGPPTRRRGQAKEKEIGAAQSAREQARGRGGLTTKVIVAASDEDTVIAVDVVPEQASDAPLLQPMLHRTL